MGWWSSVVGTVKTVGTKIGSGVKWVWDNASLAKITTGVFTFAANTTFQVLEQGMALQKAVPALINNPETKKIVSGMAYVALVDVLPIVAMNYVNNGTQNYFRTDYDDSNNPWYAPYSVFLSALTLVNYTVQAITWRQGAQAFVRVTALDSLGPTAFNTNKTTPTISLCKELDCNFKRQGKGALREPFILMGNSALVAGVSRIPYAGPIIGSILRPLIVGRFITRQVTPELCERHKFQQSMQESILALGLTYELTTWLMDKALEATVGMPPWLYYYAMRHLLLLLHINVAANMTLPVIQAKDATIPIDILNWYERFNRFVVDVVFAGLMKRIPIDFKREKDAKPLIPLSPALQFFTGVLNSDLEKERRELPGLFRKSVNAIVPWVLPSMFQSTDGLLNDHIIKKYWPTIRQGGIDAIEFVESYGKKNTVAVLAWAPATVATAVNLKFGLPKKIVKVILMLSQEKDFWDLVQALKLWFERHNVKFEVKMVDKPTLALMGAKPIELPPKDISQSPVAAAIELIPERVSPKSVVLASDLIPVRDVRPSQTADAFFTTRVRKRVPALPPSESPKVQIIDDWNPVSNSLTQ